MNNVRINQESIDELLHPSPGSLQPLLRVVADCGLRLAATCHGYGLRALLRLLPTKFQQLIFLKNPSPKCFKTCFSSFLDYLIFSHFSSTLTNLSRAWTFKFFSQKLCREKYYFGLPSHISYTYVRFSTRVRIEILGSPSLTSIKILKVLVIS